MGAASLVVQHLFYTTLGQTWTRVKIAVKITNYVTHRINTGVVGKAVIPNVPMVERE